MNRIMRFLPEIMLTLFIILFAGAFLSPLLFKLGLDGPAELIQSIYRIFCHQRVERSLFLFGEDKIAAFYSLDELRSLGAIPDYNPYIPLSYAQHSRELYQYPYWGNEQVGYKVAFCIRDVGMYLGIIIGGLSYFIYYHKTKNLKKFKFVYLLILMLPMALDGGFQTLAELFNLNWVSSEYIDNIPKRIITGLLFGLGFSLFVFPLLKENVTMVQKNEKSRSNK